MKILPVEVSSKGFVYRQVTRRGNVAIYSQHPDAASKPIAYEVIVIKSHDGYVIGGISVAAAEMYPGDAKWGSLGFTYSLNLNPDNAFDLALDKMAQVEETLAKKAST